MNESQGTNEGGFSSSDWTILFVVLVAAALWGFSMGSGPLGFLKPKETPTYVPRAPLNGYNPYNPSNRYNSYNPYPGGIGSSDYDYPELDPVPMCPNYPGLPTEC